MGGFRVHNLMVNKTAGKKKSKAEGGGRATPKWQRNFSGWKKKFASESKSYLKDGPMVQEGHYIFTEEYARHRYPNKFEEGGAGFSMAPMPIEKVAKSPGTIFSLTGGFTPTWTQDFNGAGHYYRRYHGGNIIVNEALTSKGPGPMYLRGNHVWYKYAKDYMTNVNDILQAAPMLGMSNKRLWTHKESDYMKIFNVYAASVGAIASDLLITWRDKIGVALGEEGKELVSKATMEGSAGARKKQQAPEEMINDFLRLEGVVGRDGNVVGGVEEKYTAITGGAKGIDVMFKYGDRIYIVDVTQSRLDSGSTHSSMGTFRLSVKEQTKLGLDQATYIEEKATTHFTKSMVHVNLMLRDIVSEAERLRGKNKKLMKDMSVREILQQQGWTSGDHVNEEYIKGQVGKLYTKSTDELKREHLKFAFEEALHILGASTAALDDWRDIAVTGMDPPYESFMIGAVYTTTFETVKGGKTGSLPQLALNRITYDIDHAFFMDWFMKSEMGLKNAERHRLIQMANATWMMQGQYLTLENIVTNQVMGTGEAIITSKGYQLAGGVVLFAPAEVNEKLGEVLQEIVEGSIGQPQNQDQRVKETLDKGMRMGARFSALWKQGVQGLSSVETEKQQDDNLDLAYFENKLSWDIHEMTSMQGADLGPKKWKKMNQMLRQRTWAMPYVGVQYQAGGSQKMETLLTS